MTVQDGKLKPCGVDLLVHLGVTVRRVPLKSLESLKNLTHLLLHQRLSATPPVALPVSHASILFLWANCWKEVLVGGNVAILRKVTGFVLLEQC